MEGFQSIMIPSEEAGNDIFPPRSVSIGQSVVNMSDNTHTATDSRVFFEQILLIHLYSSFFSLSPAR